MTNITTLYIQTSSIKVKSMGYSEQAASVVTSAIIQVARASVDVSYNDVAMKAATIAAAEAVDTKVSFATASDENLALVAAKAASQAIVAGYGPEMAAKIARDAVSALNRGSSEADAVTFALNKASTVSAAISTIVASEIAKSPQALPIVYHFLLQQAADRIQY